MYKWWYRRILIMILILTTVISCGFGMKKMDAKVEKRSISNQISKSVYLGGMPIGLYMETDGVMVLGTEVMEDLNGTKIEPGKNIVKDGDYILRMNGNEIEDKKELIQEVNKLEDNKVILGIRRDGQEFDVKMECVEVARSKFKLGIWVKDNAQGLGTLTYIANDGSFGALGHGIHDTETGDLIEIKSGMVYLTKIIGITKGKKGEPGGLEGIIFYNKSNRKGIIKRNTENGIYGIVDDISKLTEQSEAVPICQKKDIELGNAKIRCTIGTEIEEFDIRIKNVDYYTKNVNKGIVIEITDPRLLDKTGGIVQGMSGSPIIQDGKIIGAVTHVLVNDPTRGYGIFIENMLDAAG